LIAAAAQIALCGLRCVYRLAVRAALVRTRTRYLGLAKALVRRDGLRVASTHAEYAAARIAGLDLDPTLHAELDPLFMLLVPLNEQIRAADARTAAIGESDPAVRWLMSVPSIGPVTATAVVATVDDVSRFTSAHEFEAFLGLLPSEHSSGEKHRLGSITKAGNQRVRFLLVEAAWRILRSSKPESAALREWALRIAERRGRRTAVVALARRLAGVLYAVWRDGRPFNAAKLRRQRCAVAA
jgi:transposase